MPSMHRRGGSITKIVGTYFYVSRQRGVENMEHKVITAHGRNSLSKRIFSIHIIIKSFLKHLRN